MKEQTRMAYDVAKALNSDVEIFSLYNNFFSQILISIYPFTIQKKQEKCGYDLVVMTLASQAKRSGSNPGTRIQ